MAGNTVAGITTRTYKSGSIIYFDGDRSDNIYILKSGKVFLTSIKLDTGEEIKENVRLGEFFGVKSALGKYPREETAQTVGETTVLVLKTSDFEKLILKNVSIVRKMLRVFSNQLRRVHKMVGNALGQVEMTDPAAELFNIAEYYYKTGVYNQALYAYKKYMEHYPDAGNASKALQRINEIGTGNYKPEDVEKPQKAQPGILDDMDDFTLDSDDFWSDDSGKKPDAFSDTSEDKSQAETSFDSEFGDFFADSEDSLPDFDDFSMDDAEEPKAADKFGEASSLFEQKRFGDALNIYQSIVDSGGFMDDDDMARAYLGLGKCKVKLGKNKDALQVLNNLIKNYPSAACANEAYFEVGDIFLAGAQKDKALQYFKKAASIQPKGPIADKAAMKIKQLG